MNHKSRLVLLSFVLTLILACNLPFGATPTSAPSLVLPEQSPEASPAAATLAPTDTPLPPPNPQPETPSAGHQLFPADFSEFGALNYDVESYGTAPEKRAPLGDSYNLYLLERPFTQDMSYIPELDIRTFGTSADATWQYVTLELIGKDSNRTPAIHYGVVLDLNQDGFGDFLLWASPPYSTEWTAANVQVFADTNGDSAGLSPKRSDAVFSGNGYETLIYDVTQGIGDDPDLAWVRLLGDGARVQFAFKKELVGAKFMFGVIADAGLQDPTRMDYVDYLTESQAGSPLRGNPYYPLKDLFQVDNTCHGAFGFVPTGFEPKVCPRIVPPTEKSASSGSEPTPDMTLCQPPPGGCGPNAPHWWPHPHCACSTIPYNP
ncbi:MAG: hypothetical protein DDG60_00670 [Anaerolineae bacterium]|nr:MAG: hypothetical protein DDG60_00670 [Anaerolineae bacterium]